MGIKVCAFTVDLAFNEWVWKASISCYYVTILSIPILWYGSDFYASQLSHCYIIILSLPTLGCGSFSDISKSLTKSLLVMS